jgi:hypothetical protein
MGPTEYLALEPLQAINMALYRTRTPGQCHARFDCLEGLIQSLGKALKGRQHTCGGAPQPGNELLGLPLVHARRNVLREVDRIDHFSMLRVQLGKLLCLGLGACLLALEHQPNRPARRQGLVRGLSHDGSIWPGCQFLGPAHATGIGRDEGIALSVATLCELGKQSHGVAASGIPACEEGGFVGIQGPCLLSLRCWRQGQVAVWRSPGTVR